MGFICFNISLDSCSPGNRIQANLLHETISPDNDCHHVNDIKCELCILLKVFLNEMGKCNNMVSFFHPVDRFFLDFVVTLLETFKENKAGLRGKAAKLAQQIEHNCLLSGHHNYFGVRNSRRGFIRFGPTNNGKRHLLHTSGLPVRLYWLLRLFFIQDDFSDQRVPFNDN